MNIRGYTKSSFKLLNILSVKQLSLKDVAGLGFTHLIVLAEDLVTSVAELTTSTLWDGPTFQIQTE